MMATNGQYTDAAPSGQFWIWADPDLIGLTSTEWWLVYEQIKGALCWCTDSRYYTHDLVQADWKWKGTVITPSQDRYRVVANASRPATMYVTHVEKL